MSNVFNYGINSIYNVYYFWLCGLLPFLFATTTEYFTGELILPIVNGPSDGMCLVMLFLLLQYIMPGFWSNTIVQSIPLLSQYIPSISHLPSNTVVLLLGWLGIIPTILSNIYSVSKHRNLLNGPMQLYTPFIVLIITASLWIFYSPIHIFEIQPRIFITTTGLLFSNLICKVMLAHIQDKQYNILRIELIPYFLGAFNALYISNDKQYINELHTLYSLLIYTIALHSHFAIHVIDDMTSILGIKAFTIIKKQQIHPIAHTHVNGINESIVTEHGNKKTA